jgi:hypothetical protein
MKTYLALLTLGKSDFEAVADFREDQWFKECLDINRLPSIATLRQRLDRHAVVFEKCASECSVELLKNVNAEFSPVSTGHIPLDIDVFPMDNSDTKKEGVSRTYQGFDGYAPIAAYLGNEGWCLGLELREGKQHSQNGFIPFLRKMFTYARSLTNKELLIRLDSAHDSQETLLEVRQYNKTSYIVKWNPRNHDKNFWRNKAFREGRVEEPRAGKKVAVFTVRESIEHESESYRFTRVMRVTERTIARNGQILAFPEIEVEGWWTNLGLPEEHVIKLYEGRGTSEQYHSELKTDLDIERLPSGKFRTNALVLSMAGFAYNVLRIIGQNGLLSADSPVRHRAKRRRVRTVMQNLLDLAARLIRTGRRLKVRFSRHCPAFKAFQRVYYQFCPC